VARPSLFAAADSVESEDAGLVEIRFFASEAIRLYQRFLSSQDRPSCNFHPSCSRFGNEAIRRHGLQGVCMTFDRLQRCNGLSRQFYRLDPLTHLAIDPVSEHLLDAPAALKPSDANVEWELRSTPESPSPNPDRPLGSGDVSLYRPDAILTFADHLYASGEYARAAGEYERLLIALSGDSPTSDTLRYRAGLALRRAQQPERAYPLFRRVLDRSPDPEMKLRALRQVTYSLWDQGRYLEAQGFAADSAARGLDDSVANQRRTLVAASQLLQGNYAAARQSLLPLRDAGTPADRGTVKRLLEVAELGERRPRRSLSLALTMSALAPGTGRIYAGRKYDGLFALATFALTLWQSIDGFREGGDNSTKGWIYAAISLGFYSGNLYGTALAVRSFNRSSDLKVFRRVLDRAAELNASS
jgi:putative component of membrane protein insertase Oxa1/YidC/SpoIIIJ protein YidD/tetratricopeptide (TPR) repeat protein